MMKKHPLQPILVVAFGILVSNPPLPSWGAHPLITDDTGTQGKGKFQVEVTGGYGADRETSPGVETTERDVEAAAAFSCGVTDAVDAVIGVPYVRVETRESDLTAPGYAHANEKGLSDISLELKWRFFEREGVSLAFKPGIAIPTGNEDRGLGAGGYGIGAFVIATEELKPLTFHQNIGYFRNNNRHDEREGLYHVSLACEYEMAERLRLVANVGRERNPDTTTARDPAFGLAGIIWGITENVDVDAGFKIGLSGPETDRTALAGIAWRF
jgi:hypothetical protein